MVATRNANGEAILRRIMEKAFLGRPPGSHNVLEAAGVPDEAADVGILCYDSTNDDCYICTEAAGTWVKINA